MKQLNYTLIIKPEPEGGFTVTVPALPGCVTYGATVEEAKTMAADAIGAYLTSLRKHREPIPHDIGSFVTTLTVRQGAI